MRDTAVCFATRVMFDLSEQMRAADQALTEDERAEAREEGEQGGRSAKYCLKEVIVSEAHPSPGGIC